MRPGPGRLDRLEGATWRRCAPPPRLSLSEWADRYRRLPAESAAEPGYWSTARVPYLREILDAVTDGAIETVVLVKSSQVGGTEVLLNAIGYHAHVDPAPILLLEPTLDMAAAVAKDRIAPMVRDTEVLRERFSTPRARDGQNTTLHKTFPGGHLTLAGANSPASLASRPIRVLLADEVDRWPAALPGEGDPLALALARTLTFARRKIVIISSPTVAGASRIEDWWALSDQRRYHVPCPACGAHFLLEWAAVRWDEGAPETARLACARCEAQIPATDRDALVARGTWVPTQGARGRIAGFHVPGLVAPWRSVADHVRSFLAARQSLEARQTWTNTVKGDWWIPPVEGGSLEIGALLLRRESFGPTVPAGVRLVTVGVDVQDDRLVALVLGWGTGEEAWTLDYVTLPGDPARPEVWTELDTLLARAYLRAEGGMLRAACTLVDAGGHKTDAVYQAVIPRQPRRVFASFGRRGGEKGLLVSPPKPIRPKDGRGTVLRRLIDVDQAKALIMARLRLTEPGPEYMHLGRHVADEAFLGELTAEVLVTKRNKYGVPTKVWEQRRDRNEALDCWVLALGALRVVAPTAERFEAVARDLARDPVPATTPATTRAPGPPAPRRPGWLAPRPGWLAMRP